MRRVSERTSQRTSITAWKVRVSVTVLLTVVAGLAVMV